MTRPSPPQSSATLSGLWGLPVSCDSLPPLLASLFVLTSRQPHRAFHPNTTRPFLSSSRINSPGVSQPVASPPKINLSFRIRCTFGQAEGALTQHAGQASFCATCLFIVQSSRAVASTSASTQLEHHLQTAHLPPLASVDIQRLPTRIASPQLRLRNLRLVSSSKITRPSSPAVDRLAPASMF